MQEDENIEFAKRQYDKIVESTSKTSKMLDDYLAGSRNIKSLGAKVGIQLELFNPDTLEGKCELPVDAIIKGREYSSLN